MLKNLLNWQFYSLYCILTLTPSLKIAPTDSISPITKMACNKLCLGQFLSQSSNNFKLALNGFFSLNKYFENIYWGLSKAANRRYLYFLPYSYTRKARYQSPDTPRTQIYSLIIWMLVINMVLSDSKELWKRNRNVRIWVCSSFNIKKRAKKKKDFDSSHCIFNLNLGVLVACRVFLFTTFKKNCNRNK